MEERLQVNLDFIFSKKTETETIELKACNKGLHKEIYKTFSSFSNTKGGMIIFGINEDNYEAVGVYNVDDLQKNYQN